MLLPNSNTDLDICLLQTRFPVQAAQETFWNPEVHIACVSLMLCCPNIVSKFHHVFTEGKIKILLFFLPINEQSHDIHFLEVS